MQMYKFVNYKMKEKEVIHHIKNWILKYSKNSGSSGFVIGISGGIDSALTSTLCGLTGIKTLCLNMPIKQKKINLKGQKII